MGSGVICRSPQAARWASCGKLQDKTATDSTSQEEGESQGGI